jgi:flagellar biosynthesis protein FlhA
VSATVAAHVPKRPLAAPRAELGNLLLALGVLGIVGIMLIPLPPFLLDLLITANIALSLVVLMVTLYAAEPLEVSVFPTLLLGLTLFRLALNVASTRLILMKGYAGQVIDAFGVFMVGGNMVIGLVLFAILVVIQFLVITKGAGRVAEVAARFTLDAMPGKQMAIDADLNAGLIDEKEARSRRETIARAADFYGAMDGASKFVRGDAIAAIVITLVNILGGIVIGVFQHKMPLLEAMTTYTRLTVGDGLVTQIPALIVSTAAGILVTRAASATSLGRELAGQLLIEPRAPLVVAGILFLFALVPGLPTIPFLALAGVTAAIGASAKRAPRPQSIAHDAADDEPRRKEEEKERIKEALQVDALEVEIGYGLIPMVDARASGNLLDRITLMRRQMAQELGFVVPAIRIRDNARLRSREYVIKLKGVRLAGYELAGDYHLAMNPGTASGRVGGIETREPAFGLPAVWIPESQRGAAEALGYTVVEPVAVVATHLAEVVKAHAHEILSRQDVQSLLDTAKEKSKAVVEELVPTVLTVGGVQRILTNLLRERVSIRDLPTILEAVADGAAETKDVGLLTEIARQRLGRSIVKPYLDSDGRLHAAVIARDVEEALLGAAVNADGARDAGLAPEAREQVVGAATRAIEKGLGSGKQPVLLGSAAARPVARRLFEPYFPTIPVLSYKEIPHGVEVRSVGRVEVSRG